MIEIIRSAYFVSFVCPFDQSYHNVTTTADLLVFIRNIPYKNSISVRN